MAWAIAVARALRRGARIRYRLLLVNLLVAVVPLVGIAFARMHERQLLGALERDMIHQGQLVRALLRAPASGAAAASLEPVLVAAARDTRTRIRLLDGSARVLVDSHRRGPPEGAEPPVPRLGSYDSPIHPAEVPREVPLAERREVRQALAGRYGAATRLWPTQERVYLFVALPVSHPEARAVYVTRSTQDVKLQLYRLRSSLFQLLLYTLAATALLSLLLSTTIARPLARLTLRAQRVAARQQPPPGDERLVHRADEIGDLARALAAMTDELERRARDARTLAADLSHELKNPLAGIRGATELLRDGAADDPVARERFLDMIALDAARLDRIVTRLLEVARAEDDRGPPLPVDVAALARALAARPWPCPVLVSGPPSAIVPGRAAALSAALENLIANATQHAAPATPVLVTLDAGATLRVTVTNRGPALSEAARRRVWDRFYTTRSASGGSGLGLAIVRAVALSHGGAVGVTCADGLTSFSFELPR